MTPQFWNHIQPQLNEIIANTLGDTQPADSLLRILDKPYWWDAEPFNRMRVWDERNDLRFVEWLNAAESLVGKAYADIFEQELVARLKNTIEYQWELRMKEGQEKLNHELKEVA